MEAYTPNEGRAVEVKPGSITCTHDGVSNWGINKRALLVTADVM